MNTQTNPTTFATPTSPASLTSLTPPATPDFITPTISSSSMLVELSISHWTGRKKDRGASDTVTSDNNAETGAASVTKKLLGNSDELTAIQRMVTSIRNMHSNMTMPWSNSGLRLLPTAQYFKYHQEMTRMRGEFDKLVSDFLTGYEFEVARAQVKLGDLFNDDDYPTPEALQNKFDFSMNYLPLPDAGHFVLDMANEAMADLKREYAQFYTKQYEAAMADVWKRTYAALSRMSERLDYTDADQKKVFHNTLVSNVADMVELLRVCNVTNDTQMAAMATNLEDAISGVTPEALREDGHLRLETKRAVDKAIAALPTLDF